MPEYIKRETVIKRVMETKWESGSDGASAIEIVAATPAADVAPVRHGRWLCVDTDTEQFFLCNRCKKKEYWESDYCPSCGAKMDGEPCTPSK